MSDEEREQRILDAMFALVQRYGYDKTTVSDIAREAGVSKGAIYLHYSSKEDLFEALIWREGWVYAEEWLAEMEREAEWTFVSMYQAALRLMNTKPLMQAIARGDESILGSFLRKHGHKFSQVKRPFQYEMLYRLQEVGAIRADIDVKAAMLVMQTFSTGFIYANEIEMADRPTNERLILEYGEVLNRYLLPEDGGNPEAGKQVIKEIVAAMRGQLNKQSKSEE